ncbi:GntR family transcriptional regulator [Yinghuangia seranimata]|uniref:GntR family transcriptional regulator n=1 Tax=Yinghuangia seranimata TaxID=408067 RepID=UPI00248A93BD|nr:GntR family transcriptional regulator [Yinghuangia seranimata]MDI2125074.1 GntR family transcriptional regulator [Yinghuangia seranimata]
MSGHFSPRTRVPARRVLREDVADVIRNSIMVGELRRGSRLDVSGLAAELDVSQLPVREALIALAAEGLVRAEPRRGYYVEELAPVDVLDHYEIYGKISGIAVARASKLMTDQDIDDLQALNDRMRAAEDPQEQEALNNEIHGRINRVGASRRLRSVLLPLSHGMDVRFGVIIPGWQRNAANEHDAIIAALRVRDEDTARAAMEHHLVVNGQRAVDALTEAGFFQTGDEPAATR